MPRIEEDIEVDVAEAYYSDLQRVISGTATSDEIIRMLPTMDHVEIGMAGYEWAYNTRGYTKDAKKTIKEMEYHDLDVSQVAFPPNYVYDLVREVTGAENLYEGKAASRRDYKVLLDVTLASMRHHDDSKEDNPQHMTKEFMELVLEYGPRNKTIIRYMNDRKLTAFRVDFSDLRDYLNGVYSIRNKGHL